MSFFWFVEPWRALLGKQRNNAKTSQPISLGDAFADYSKANPKQRQAVGRAYGALVRSGYESLDDLKNATDADLLRVKGIGQYALKFIREVEETYDDSD